MDSALLIWAGVVLLLGVGSWGGWAAAPPPTGPFRVRRWALLIHSLYIGATLLLLWVHPVLTAALAVGYGLSNTIAQGRKAGSAP